MDSTPEAWIVSMTIRDIETTDNLSDCGIYQQVEAITGNKLFEIMNKEKFMGWLHKRISSSKLILENPKFLDGCKIDCKTPKKGYKFQIVDPEVQGMGPRMEIELGPLKIIEDGNHGSEKEGTPTTTSSKGDTNASSMGSNDTERSPTTTQTSQESETDDDDSSDPDFEYDFESHYDEATERYSCGYHEGKDDECLKVFKKLESLVRHLDNKEHYPSDEEYDEEDSDEEDSDEEDSDEEEGMSNEERKGLCSKGLEIIESIMEKDDQRLCEGDFVNLCNLLKELHKT